MILAEGNITAHQYFFVAGVVLLILFLIYVYVYEHRTFIEGDELWENAFSGVGLLQEIIKDISHDEDVWYYRGNSTCVAYGGDFSEECSRYENYCAGEDRYGDAFLQAMEVKKAIDSGGEHPLCPLIYPGTN